MSRPPTRPDPNPDLDRHPGPDPDLDLDLDPRTRLDRQWWDELRAALVGQGLSVPAEPRSSAAASGRDAGPGFDLARSAVPALTWADSGLMWLTGSPGAPPTLPDGPVIGRCDAAARMFAALSAERGQTQHPEVATLLGGRAALLGLSRHGRRSAGGSCRLLPTADGWIAVNLARTADLEAVAALLGALGADPAPAGAAARASEGGPPGPEYESVGSVGSVERQAEIGLVSPQGAWSALSAAVRDRPATEVVELAQLLSMPVSALRTDRRPPPVRTHPVPGARPGAAGSWGRRARPGSDLGDLGGDGLLVVDLSAMWAGPLCAYLLGRIGCRVIKVESARRLDGARHGSPAFYDWLHAGHESVLLDFATADGRAMLRRLLDHADVVIESSRPRALAQLGIEAPEVVAARAGRVWVSITGYGRTFGSSCTGPDPVAFGDDAAVAGGLVGWQPGEHAAAPTPVFCADAIADPLTGLFAAVAVTASLRAGGGHLLDVAMRDVAAWVGAPPDAAQAARMGAGAGAGAVRVTGSDQRGWTVHQEGRSGRVARPRPPWPSGTDGSRPRAPEPGAHTRAVLAGLLPA
ncbi:CoA transferase [Frankia sp. AiPa1]|uniref:CoA transferase n=1 Tax=Frankia sp. AiPa1 TaxID=573492 RepID=UPI00202B6189|nr:CoA transferase [Frankia sp. AiPa1]MCL9761449.1 CoA transferase [Frankia sp. AiPa1]